MRRFNLDLALRVLAALLIAGAVCGFVRYAYPEDLSLRTDIVGYPIVQDFNPRVYTVDYLLISVAFPVLAIAVFSVLELVAGRRPRLPGAFPVDEPEPPAVRRDAPLLAYVKLAAVGLLIATAVAVGVGATSLWPLYLGVPITVAYVLGARFVARLIPVARAGTALNAIAAVNAAVASLSLLAIAVASETAQVDVASPPSSVHYTIAPLWSLLLVGLVPALVVCTLLVRRKASDWRRIESWTLLALAAPVAVFLGIAHIVGELLPPDMFHEGERLGASNLVFGADRFPWRDVLFAHGLLGDVLLPELDTAATSYSRWGLTTGIGMVERPMFWISSLALCVYLFRRNWLFLIASPLLLLVFGWFDQFENYRMMLLPLSLLAMAAMLARSTWPRALLLMGATGAQAILVPEATGYSAVIWAAVIAYELVHRRCPGAEPWRTSRSLRIAVSGAALGAAFVVFLALFDSVDGFVDYYTTFVGGHDLTGGFPIQWGDFGFHAWVYIPVAVILIGWAYGAVRIWSGRWLTIADWVVGAAVIGLIPYYLKFLARADDGHLYQVATVAVIPGLYVIYRFLQFLDARGEGSGRNLLRYRPATLVFVLLAIVFAPTAPGRAIGDLPDRFEGTAEAEPTNDRVGYIVPGADTDRLVGQVQRVIDEYAPDGSVFDFTNSPLLFDYLVDDNPATRFFHVSMAVPADAQQEVIDELSDEKPELLAYSSIEHGLSNWDVVSNPVRHYLISDYLLDHYHPVARVSDYVFMARNDAAGVPGPQAKRPASLYFEGLPCEWGYAPNFLDQAPADPADGVGLPTKPLGVSSGAGGWAVDLEAGLPAREVLAVDGNRIVATAPLGVRRPDVALRLDNPSLTYAGFEFREALAETGDPSSLTYFGLSQNGVASELGTPASPPPKTLRRPGGGEIPVEQGVVRGSVDYRLPALDRYELRLPADFHSFDWLRVDGAQPLPTSRFLLSDGDAAAGRTIAFNALAGRESEQIRVGSCPQWFGYNATRLFLDVTPGAGPITTRLVG